MKILFIQGGFGAGGAEKVMSALATHRESLGDEVHVAAMMMPLDGSFFPYPDTVKLHVLAEDAPKDRFLQLRRGRAIRRLIQKLRPDLIISFLTKVNCLTLLAAAGTGVPVIISERNNPRIQSAGFWSKLQNRLAPRAAGIAMQTQGAASMLPNAQRDRAHIIPNPCKPIEFERAPVSQTCRFVAVGRLDRQKGFDRLIEAFVALPPELPARLDIFGQGQEEQALSDLIQRHGIEDRIRLAGLAHTARDWMSKGDVVVVSSRYEGFSNVLAEATTSGLPAIAFDCPFGVSEMVIDGRNGLLVPDGDIQGLTAAMERLARDPGLRNQLTLSTNLISERLSPGRINGLWDNLIAEAIETRPVKRRRQIESSAASS